MIKFFRNIRQNLIMENKTSKYLKYAIGEIVLVVIGILIALQVNNWNEDRKGQHWQRNFLRELNIELQDNFNQLQEVYVIQSKRIEACKTISELVDNGNESNIDKIDSLFYAMQKSNRTFFPTTGVYDLGMASGKMENLKNVNLKYAIMNLYNHFYKRLVYNGELEDGVEEKINWEKRVYYDVTTQKIKSWSHIIDPEFNNQILYILERTNIYNGLVKKNLDKISELIEMTEKEINKR